MFLDHTIGSLSPETPQTLIIDGIQKLNIIQTKSHTGNYERRDLIRTWKIDTCIMAHNILVSEIIRHGTISEDQRNIILSMEQECIEMGGVFSGKIQENTRVHMVPHDTGISRFNELQGKTDTLTGETRLQLWTIIE